VHASHSGNNPADEHQSYATANLLDTLHKQIIQVGRQVGITSPSNGVLQAVSAYQHHSRVLTDVTKSQLREKFTSTKIERKKAHTAN
jgi:hypothetical protein